MSPVHASGSTEGWFGGRVIAVGYKSLSNVLYTQRINRLAKCGVILNITARIQVANGNSLFVFPG